MPRDFEKDDIEVIDADSGYREDNDSTFSHQGLVMLSMRNTIDAGTKEMRSGWWNTVTNNRGDTKIIYVEDTRKAFVENVKNCLMVMACDFDDEAKKKVEVIKKELKTKFDLLLEQEKYDWEHISIDVKRSRWNKGIFLREGYLSTELPYYQDYINEEVEAHRKIFEELSHLSKRLDFYKEVMFIN